MRRNRFTVLGILSAVSLMLGIASEGLAQVDQRTALSDLPGYVQDAEVHPDHMGVLGDTVLPRDFEGRPDANPNGLSHKVFGFLPYWTGTSNVRWDLLTHVSCFGIEFNQDGSIADSHSWPWTTTINTARSHNVKVILTAILFNESKINTLLGSVANRQRFIDNCIDMLNLADADGLNIDFEGGTAWHDDYASFLGELRIALDTHRPGSELSVDGITCDWADTWDEDGLAQHCDYIVVMAYDFFGSWSTTTGPVAPMGGYGCNVASGIDDTYAGMLPGDSEKIVMAVPYYGQQWTTNGPSPGAAVVSYDGVVTFSNGASTLAADRSWHALTMTPYRSWQSGGVWKQLWLDDAESIGIKFDHAIANDFGGVGMWALGFDGTRDEYWDEIELHFLGPENNQCANATPITSGTWPFSSIGATTDGVDHPEACADVPAGSLQNDVWFTTTAPGDGVLIFDLCNTDFDVSFVVYQGGFCTPDWIFAYTCNNDYDCNHDGVIDAQDGGGAHAELYVEQGEPLTIRVGGHHGETGTGELGLTFIPSGSGAPPNDLCVFARPITPGSWSVDTVGANTDGPSQYGGCQSIVGERDLQQDVWYSLSAPSSGTYAFDFCGCEFDTSVILYSSASCPPSWSDAVACNDDYPCANDDVVDDLLDGYRSFLTYEATQGEELLLRVGGFRVNSGIGTMTVTFTPSDDDPVTGCPSDFNGDGTVDIIDFGTFALAFGTTTEDVGFNPAVDFNGNGVVDIIDFGVFGTQFGSGPEECGP